MFVVEVDKRDLMKDVLFMERENARVWDMEREAKETEELVIDREELALEIRRTGHGDGKVTVDLEIKVIEIE